MVDKNLIYLYMKLLFCYLDVYKEIHNTSISPDEIVVKDKDDNYLLDILKDDIRQLEEQYPALIALRMKMGMNNVEITKEMD